jgi:hypothetical protein
VEDELPVAEVEVGAVGVLPPVAEVEVGAVAEVEVGAVAEVGAEVVVGEVEVLLP